jgi:hypothetical protein
MVHLSAFDSGWSACQGWFGTYMTNRAVWSALDTQVHKWVGGGNCQWSGIFFCTVHTRVYQTPDCSGDYTESSEAGIGSVLVFCNQGSWVVNPLNGSFLPGQEKSYYKGVSACPDGAYTEGVSVG